MNNKDLLEWLYEFFKKYSTDNKFNKIIFLNSSKWFKDYIKNIENTYFRGAFEKNRLSNTKEEEGDSTSEDNEFWWYLMNLSTALDKDPLELMKKYTFWQANYFYFWAIYNSNKWTKEWDELNRSMLTNRKIQKMDLEEKKALDDIFKNLHK